MNGNNPPRGTLCPPYDAILIAYCHERTPEGSPCGKIATILCPIRNRFVCPHHAVYWDPDWQPTEGDDPTVITGN